MGGCCGVRLLGGGKQAPCLNLILGLASYCTVLGALGVPGEHCFVSFLD